MRADRRCVGFVRQVRKRFFETLLQLHVLLDSIAEFLENFRLTIYRLGLAGCKCDDRNRSQHATEKVFGCCVH